MSADNINPYAPPKSECVPTHTPAPVVRRPKSVKWALTLQVLTLIAMPVGYFRAFQEYGSIVFTESVWVTVVDSATLIACFPLVLGMRRPWVYWVGVAFLAIKLKDVAMTLLGTNKAFPYLDALTLMILYVMGALMAFLFYRFTFGRPSRDYFKV